MNEDVLYKDIETLAYSEYNLLKDLNKSTRPEKWYDSQLKFEIKDDDEINGRSWCEATTDHVRINKGVIEVYYKYFKQVTEHLTRKMLSSIMPDVEEEELNGMSFESITFENGEVIITDSKMMDNDRAITLEMFVSRFMLMHELGHIFNGHCRYLAAYDKNCLNYMPMYFNEDADRRNNISALDLRTMEMDADAFAATQEFGHILHLYNEFSSRISQPLKIFFLWTFAIRSHFLLCEDRFADNRYYEEMKHMPSSARWNLVWGSIFAILETVNDDVDVEQVCDELLNGAVCAERIFNDLKYTSYNWLERLENEESDFIGYGDEAKANWDKLRDKLDIYSRLYLYKSADSKNV